MTLAAMDGRTRRRSPDAPPESTYVWTSAELARWGGLVIISAAFLIGSWFYVAGKDTWNDQVPGMNIAILSAIVCGAANIGLLLAGRRAIGARRRELLGEPALVAGDYRPVFFTDAPSAVAAGDVTLVGAAGLSHYHLSTCSMAVGRGWPATTREAHERAGRTPCGVCRP